MRPVTAPSFDYEPLADSAIVVNETHSKWGPLPDYYYDWSLPNHGAHFNMLPELDPAEFTEIPDFDFPVPDQDVIPEMVFENDENSLPSDTKLSLASLKQEIDVSVTSDDYSSSQYSDSRSSTSYISVNPQSSPAENVPEISVPLIPIQSCIVAHARTGAASFAVAQERRIKNTESARRSRARRADKLALLREQNLTLMSRNEALTRENERLKSLINDLEARIDVKLE